MKSRGKRQSYLVQVISSIKISLSCVTCRIVMVLIIITRLSCVTCRIVMILIIITHHSYRLLSSFSKKKKQKKTICNDKRLIIVNGRLGYQYQQVIYVRYLFWRKIENKFQNLSKVRAHVLIELGFAAMHISDFF